MDTRLTHLECARCGARHDAERLLNRCECGGTLLCRYDLEGISLERVRARLPGMWRYEEMLPLRDAPVSLGEPHTPLVFAARLSERLGLETYVKDEGVLPGGTFKARGAAVALSRARELGAERIVLPSAGNAGGAWALYGARAGIDVTVTMAQSAPATQQVEVNVAGGRLELVDGTLADASRRARAIARDDDAFLAATFSEPYRVEGKKTAWLEVFDALGDERSMRTPGTIVLPVGGGVAAVAAAKAAEETAALGWTPGPAPRLVGVQAERCAPLVDAFTSGADDVEPWSDDPTTIAAGLRVPAPAEGALVLRCVRASRGTMTAVSEDDMIAAVTELASSEGVFACPEGAATLAAATRLAKDGALTEPVVLYNTGTGTKYTDALASSMPTSS